MNRIFGSAWILAVGAVLLLNSGAQAASVGGHLGMHLGLWRGSFTQTGAAQTVTLLSDVAPAFQLQAGLSLGPLFIEYVPQYYLAYLGTQIGSSEEDANDMDYYSLLGGNVGIRLPIFSFRPAVYVGGGKGNLGFISGTGADFSGPFFRVGASLDVFALSVFGFGLRAEYQKTFLKNDESGPLPSGYAARSSFFFVGLGVTLSSP